MSHYRGATRDSIKGRAMLEAVESLQGPRGEGPCNWPGCPSVWQQVDHVTPRNDGGGDEPENLQGLCAFHNGAKGDGRPHWFEPRAPRAARAGEPSRAWFA